MYDGIGGNLFCSLLPVAHRMMDFVKLVGGPPDCSIIGFPQCSSVLNADLVGMRAEEAKARELAGALKGMADVANVSEVMRRLEMPEARIEDF